jgi:hypothetical protein
MSQNDTLREQLIQLLRGGKAHCSFSEAISEFPLDFINSKPPNVAYTPWHIVEHIRLAQSDILEFVRDPSHVSPKWPEGYWPDPDAEADEVQWQASLESFTADMEGLEGIVNDPGINLLDEIPHAPGYTYLREVLLVADHNAYHIGEFAILRQVMETW